MDRNSIILNGDCVFGMRGLSAACADIVIADPPYNAGVSFDGGKMARDAYVSWSASWLGEAARILAPTGTIFVYGYPEVLCFLQPVAENLGFRVRWLVWHYTNKNSVANPFWQRSFEGILVLCRKDSLFNRDAVREPYTEAFLTGSAGRKRSSTASRFGEGAGIFAAHPKGALPRDVLHVPALSGRYGEKERIMRCRTCDMMIRKKFGHAGHDILAHPTQKPAAFTRRLILSAKPAGSFLVVVPFAGSGSECLVTEDIGGSFIGFETNPEYAALARSALEGTA